MSFNWNNVKPACCARWLVLPTVYSDALSYGEQLDKFCYQLNQLIENNNILPDFIAEMIKEYINSGAIGEVVRDILADYILNVKYPPNGIKPAVGDGSADDTEAIQGCIDYASEHGGCVYFPYGDYLTRPLTMKSGVSLFGFDRYSTKIVLKGGAESSLIGGNVSNIGIYNLTLDGNYGTQVNDVNTVTLMGTDVELSNLIIKDGFSLLAFVGTGGHFQCSDIVFGNCSNKCFIVGGNSEAQCINLIFNHISSIGVCVADISVDNSVFDFVSIATCEKCLILSGNYNKVTANVFNANVLYENTGIGNVMEITSNDSYVTQCDSLKEIYKEKSISIYGDLSEHIEGAYTKSVAKNASESYAGIYNKIVSGVSSETYNSDRTIEEKNVSETADKIVRNAKDIVLNPENPLTYLKDSVDKHVKYFKSVPVILNDGISDMIVSKNETNNVVDVIDYGAVADGVTDNTELFNSLIKNNVTIFIPKTDKPIKGNIYIDKINVEICGGGSILGTITCDAKTETDFILNTRIHDITIIGEESVELDTWINSPTSVPCGVIISRGINAKVYNCHIKNCYIGVWCYVSSDKISPSWSHEIEDVNVYNNYFEMCYIAYSQSKKSGLNGYTYDYLYIGDTYFCNNSVKVAIYVGANYGVSDGVIMSNNTIFGFNPEEGEPATKLQYASVLANNAISLTVIGNQFFAGIEQLARITGVECLIANNKFIQGKTGLFISGEYNVINGNLMYEQTAQSFVLSNLKTSSFNNFIINTNCYGFNVEGETKRIYSNDCVSVPTNKWVNGYFPYGVTKNTASVNNSDFVNVYNNEEISQLPSTGNNGDIIQVLILNNGSKFKSGGNIKLKNNVDEILCELNTVYSFTLLNEFWYMNG